MDRDKKHTHPTSPAGAGSAAQPAREPELGSELDEFFRKLQPEMRRPKPSPDAIAAAVESVKRLTAEANAEGAAESAAQELDLQSLVESNDPERLHPSSNDLGGDDSNDDVGIVLCGVCGHRNRATNRFCGMCGVVIEGAALAAPRKTSESRPRKAAPRSEASRAEASIPSASEAEAKAAPQPHGMDPRSMQSNLMQANLIQPHEERHANGHPETHHYHHHYHHHYFSGGSEGMSASANSGMSAPLPGARAADPARDAERFRSTAALRGDLSRAEAAVRRIAQEWVVACNTRHLDDLLELYGADAMVLRSNLNPIRGGAAAREFFFGALDAGLGEVELEPLRVDVVGDLAYEAGRCKALVPGSTGKRREERGKYLWVLARQGNGEWKIVSDCWSSDLTFGTLESDAPQGAAIRTNPPRKS
jgi:ketosteroid isomerase-like protein